VKSTDGGRTWKSAYLNLTDVNCISFGTLNNGLIGCRNGLFRTIDGGKTWHRITSLASENFYQVRFTSPNTVYAKNVTTNSLYKSTDGGDNWFMVFSGITTMFTFLDDNTGFVGNNSVVQKTTNGGTTWQVLPGIPFSGEGFYNLNFGSEKFGISTGTYFYEWQGLVIYVPKVSITRNGGVSFVSEELTSPRGGGGEPIFIDSLNVIFALNSQGISLSTDAGFNWVYRAVFPGSICHDLEMFDGKIYSSGFRHQFARSLDKGNTWEILNPGNSTSVASMNDVAVLGTERVICVGQSGFVYESRDAGATWNLENSGPVEYKKIVATDSSRIFLIGSNSVHRTSSNFDSLFLLGLFNNPVNSFIDAGEKGLWVCSGNILYNSTNMGSSWVMNSMYAPSFTLSIEIFNDGKGFLTTTAESGGGKLFKTTDSGDSWLEIEGITRVQGIMEFFDSDFGLLEIGNDSLFLTTDGGNDFSYMNIPGLLNPTDIIIYDKYNMTVSGNYTYTTYDGGQTWRKHDFIGITQPSLKSITLVDEFEMYGIGIDGTVWKTSNRGNVPVELAYFTALSMGNKVILQWVTETEINNFGFEIERKTPNSEWVKIGFEKGSGTSVKKIWYGHDDILTSGNGKYFYRLKQIDYDGSFKYSNEATVVVGEIPDGYWVTQNYPNPFNPGITKVTYAVQNESTVSFEIYNSLGELVKKYDQGLKSTGTYEIKFNLDDLPSAIYYYLYKAQETGSGLIKQVSKKMILLK
jgi:photosystem II stability/assembly factor-like uncharacterized protein